MELYIKTKNFGTTHMHHCTLVLLMHYIRVKVLGINIKTRCINSVPQVLWEHPLWILHLGVSEGVHREAHKTP